jgi:hypothetical protein
MSDLTRQARVSEVCAQPGVPECHGGCADGASLALQSVSKKRSSAIDGRVGARPTPGLWSQHLLHEIGVRPSRIAGVWVVSRGIIRIGELVASSFKLLEFCGTPLVLRRASVPYVLAPPAASWQVHSRSALSLRLRNPLCVVVRGSPTGCQLNYY